MEECIVYINKQAAVYWYKSCKWKLFLYVAMTVISGLSVISHVYSYFAFINLIHDLGTLLGSKYDSKTIISIFIILNTVSIILSCAILVSGIFGIKCTSECKQALISGDEKQMENALHQDRLASKIFGITVLVAIGLAILTVVSLVVLFFGNHYGGFPNL